MKLLPWLRNRLEAPDRFVVSIAAARDARRGTAPEQIAAVTVCVRRARRSEQDGIFGEWPSLTARRDGIRRLNPPDWTVPVPVDRAGVDQVFSRTVDQPELPVADD
jgi:hypothetical protein